MEVSHEQYVATFNGLPPLIRSYIVDGTAVPIVEDIGKKYSFHVDTVGQLEEKTRYMLMGLMSPAELLGELVLSGTNADVAKSVLEELNTRIFIPIQRQMRESGGRENPEVVPEPPADPASPVVETPAPLPSEQSPAPQQSVNAPPPIPAPVAAPTPVAIPKPPQARTMASDMMIVQGGSSPTAPMHPDQISPARSFQTASVPVSFSEPRPTESWQQVPVAPSVPTPPATFRPTPPILKEYGSDPYREPIAE